MARTKGLADPQINGFDLTLEDPELEAMLDEALRLEPDARAYRKYKKDARARIEQVHEKAINADEGHGGWVRVGKFRFRAKKDRREAGEVNIKEGWNWKLDIEAL